MLVLTLLLAARSAGAADFDLRRWMGTWYELAHLPNGPQAGCSDTAVHYTADGRGGFELSNTCWKGDSFKDYHGHAAPTSDPKRFRARFFFFLRSDYWIVAHDPEYRRAVVGTPDRKSLWLIAREKTVPPEEYDALVAQAKAEGFPVEKLDKTRLSGRPER